jgi:hypothetical protein
VTTASVCRLSGKLATEGCQDVELVNDHGQRERRSLVYTEYFARGTQPTTYCDLHPTHGIFGKIAGLLGAGDHPAPPPPPRVQDTGLPPSPAVVTVAGSPDPGESVPPPPKKKRGFWSRVFGIGRDDEPAKASEETKPPKKKGGG